VGRCLTDLGSRYVDISERKGDGRAQTNGEIDSEASYDPLRLRTNDGQLMH
jgi:hypothetical protein